MKRPLSVIRGAQYKELLKLTINGEILDIGGSKKAGYHELIKGEHLIKTVNINPEYGCDVIFDIEKKFPLDDKSYNAVITLNVLEHIYNYQNVISEVYRVLKTDGLFIISIPFVYGIHGSPDDYFRYTRSTLEKILSDYHFKGIKIKELGYGFFSLTYQFFEGAIPIFLRSFVKRLHIFLDKFISRISKKYQRFVKRIPVGYFVIAQK